MKKMNKLNEYANQAVKTLALIMIACQVGLSFTIIPQSLSFDCDAQPLDISTADISTRAPAIQNIKTTEPVFIRPHQRVFREDKIRASFDAHTNAKVIISLNLDAIEGNGKTTAEKINLAQQQLAIEILDLDSDLDYLYENIPAISAKINPKTFDKLLESPLVASIEGAIELQLHTAQGIPMIGGDAFRDVFDGSGISIAIVDSGIDYTHQALGGGGFPNSKVIGGYDFGNDDPDPIPVRVAHGTHCAGIAAGDIIVYADYIGGVVPGAKLYALKVMPDNSGSTDGNKITAAIDWCVSHQFDDPNNPILVISMSLGGGDYMGTCDWAVPSITNAVAAANAAGITVLASSGNDGFCDSMGIPACIRNVISVGAVFDGYLGTFGFCLNQWSCIGEVNPTYCTEPSKFYSSPTAPLQVAPYSNSFEIVDLLAPSHNAYTTDIKGIYGSSVGDYYGAMGGTSAACPYAAGAAAAIQQAAMDILNRPLTPAELKDTLTQSGSPIVDFKNNITTPLVNIADAIDSLDIFNGTEFTVFNDNDFPILIYQVQSPQWLTVFPDAGNYGIFFDAGESKQFRAMAYCTNCNYEDLTGEVVFTATDGAAQIIRSLQVEQICPKGVVDISIEQMIVANARRVARTTFEYDIAVKIKNNSQTPFADISLSLVRHPENITILNAQEITSLYLASGEEVICDGLITIAIDRSYDTTGESGYWFVNATSINGQLEQTAITTMELEAFASGGLGLAEIRRIAQEWLDEGLADKTQDGIVNYQDIAILSAQ